MTRYPPSWAALISSEKNGTPWRVLRQPTITSLCFALVTATLMRRQSVRRSPGLCSLLLFTNDISTHDLSRPWEDATPEGLSILGSNRRGSIKERGGGD